MFQLIQSPQKGLKLSLKQLEQKDFFVLKYFLLKLFNISDYKQKILIHLKSPIFLQNRFQYLISIECRAENLAE